MFKRCRRGNQAPMKVSAGTVQRNELSAILAGWSAQQDFVTNEWVAQMCALLISHGKGTAGASQVICWGRPHPQQIT